MPVFSVAVTGTRNNKGISRSIIQVGAKYKIRFTVFMLNFLTFPRIGVEGGHFEYSET